MSLSDQIANLDISKLVKNTTQSALGLLASVPKMNIPSFSQPAVNSGHTYNINMNVDKVTGDLNGAKTMFKALVNGVRSRGGNI